MRNISAFLSLNDYTTIPDKSSLVISEIMPLVTMHITAITRSFQLVILVVFNILKDFNAHQIIQGMRYSRPMTLTNLLSFKSMNIIFAFTFFIVLFSLGATALNVYAQQGGSATSGAATGGPATSGGIIISGSCNQCTLSNAPQATGGAAASGAAIGGSAAGPVVTNISTLVDKGNALVDLGMYLQAIQYYDKALDIDPSNKYTIYNKGNALERLGNHTQAIQYFDKAISIDPNFGPGLANKGNTLSLQGNYAEAITYFDKALAIDPNDKIALAGKQAALSKMGQPE